MAMASATARCSLAAASGDSCLMRSRHAFWISAAAASSPVLMFGRLKPRLQHKRADADEDGDVDDTPQPSLQRTARLRKNQTTNVGSLRSQHGARLRLRAERGPSPQELVKQASLAARLQDLDIIRLEAGVERREPAQWDELRVWDPGDG